MSTFSELVQRQRDAQNRARSEKEKDTNLQKSQSQMNIEVHARMNNAGSINIGQAYGQLKSGKKRKLTNGWQTLFALERQEDH